MRKTLTEIAHTFPLRLLQLQLREHLMLLLVWGVLALMTSGLLFPFFGLRYLLLMPEYLGVTGPLSFLVLGTAFGTLAMTWHLATYLLLSRRFPFLAARRRPFGVFAINNALLPLAFLLYWLWASARVQMQEGGLAADAVALHLGAFLLGVTGFVALIGLYLGLTNRNIEDLPLSVRARRESELGAHAGNEGVRSYLNDRLRFRRVRSTHRFPAAFLRGIHRQHHLNALILQAASVAVLLLLGRFAEESLFRLPAGASLFILAALGLSVAGAVSFWAGKWRFAAILLMLVGVEFLSARGRVLPGSQAYGLIYGGGGPEYSTASLRAAASPERMSADRDSMERILDAWKSRQGEARPRMVILAASGGGLKAALWTTHVLEELESCYPGEIRRRTVLMTGASGGSIGLALVRESWRAQEAGAPVVAGLREMMSRDLLNPVAFGLAATDLFRLGGRFRLDGHSYPLDRGTLFEQQLDENTAGLLDRRLGALAAEEREARVPMLLLTPVIVNDGRRLLIGTQGVGHLCRPPGRTRMGPYEVDGADFRTLFGAQGADSLRLLSALRMSASYPYVLPAVSLPSVPPIDILDAGLRDNSGISMALRFLHAHRQWIQKHTGGVLLVHIRASGKSPIIDSTEQRGLVSRVLTPFGLLTEQARLQEFEQDSGESLLQELLGPGMLSVVHFNYDRGERPEPASLSFHLTRKEKQNILDAWALPHNLSALDRLATWITDQR